ncbi:MAG: outer membrane protein [Afipia sp.]
MKGPLIAAAMVVLGTTGALAADLSARPYTKAPIIAPVHNWTGFYAGANLGGAWTRTSTAYEANDPASAFIFQFINLPANGDRSKSSGIMGGLQAGYNYQFDRSWIAGLETDLQFASIKGSSETSFLGDLERSAASSDIKLFGSVRARLGYLPADNVLVYATGGFAYAQLNNAASLSAINGGNIGPLTVAGYSANCGVSIGLPPTCYTQSPNRLVPGWTVGGGIEYAFAPRWSLKGEYLYANFQETIAPTAVSPSVGAIASSYSAKFSTELNIVRIGFNYKFGH